MTATSRGGLRFAIAKARRALRDGTLRIKAERYARNLFWTPVWAVTSDVRDRRRWPIDVEGGFADHRGTAHELRCTDAALERICSAYQATARDRPADIGDLQVRGLWAEWLDLHYGDLRQMLERGEVRRLRLVLENLHRDPLSIGVGGTIDDVSSTWRPAAGHYYRALFRRYASLLEEVRPGWTDVVTPCVGNPHGVLQADRLVTLESLRYASHATVLAAELDGPPATVLEIGGGLAGQAIQFLRLGAVESYTIIDLPEVGALASYVLLAALGESSVALYGEPRGDAIVTILPPWAITQVEPMSVDLAFNAYSFSEMDGRTAAFYLQQIERVTRRLFFHVNHETRFKYRDADGATSLNRLGSELVPSSGNFQLGWLRPQPFVRPEQRARVAFQYLYERQ